MSFKFFSSFARSSLLACRVASTTAHAYIWSRGSRFNLTLPWSLDPQVYSDLCMLVHYFLKFHDGTLVLLHRGGGPGLRKVRETDTQATHLTPLFLELFGSRPDLSYDSIGLKERW